MLKKLPVYADAKIIRTRDSTVIDKADIVVDVGGTYDHANHRYDHHQRGFMETFDSNYDIKLSSAGLIYKHYGKQVIQSILKWDSNHPQLNFIYQKIYDDLILMFDGVDNGVSQYPKDIDPKYSGIFVSLIVDGTCISARVSRLNPNWNETTNDEVLFNQFLKAIEITGEELVSKVNYVALVWLPARDIVVEALESRFKVHESGKILILPRYCPWQSHLFELEELKGLKESELPLYVLYEDSSKAWRIQAVAESPGSFASRKALPEPWRGVRDDALSTLTKGIL
ncbi:hypothetical protein HDV02_005723 [Globomyces sp. JEL0801]|nr:hypothetical protein HDV02_005723 [Globomyces sp. JEL0801]